MTLMIPAVLVLSGCATAPAERSKVDRPVTSDEVAVALPAVRTSASDNWSSDYEGGLGDLALRLGGHTPMEAGGPIVSSGLSFAALDKRLSYSAGYRVDPGDFLTPSAVDSWRSDAMPSSVGSQVLSQQANLKLDPIYGAPIMLGARYRQQDALLINGNSQTDEQALDLNWAPKFVALHLSWAPAGAPVDTMQALQCGVSGQVRVPVNAFLGGQRRGRFFAIDAGSRECHVVGDTAALDELTANTWSTGVSWGHEARETMLQVQGVTPGPGANVIKSTRPLTAGSGYEVELTQKRKLGRWQATGGVAWRRPPDPIHDHGDDSSPWAASAKLSRRVSMVEVAASWRRGDPYWFLPDVRQQSNNFAVTVDFSPWASTFWDGKYTPTMALSYSWMRADDSETTTGRTEDQAINWSVAFPWPYE
ncbi:hypothetical protein [Solimonas marina]|uniref:Uncharacterized protein n=1 Tax=Solimonas marina TaxID=2714601 RepID=A0A969W839_9GAMM|nr:hypothetical protein [Solimonas marina]NKF22152.1 hypothetical protein [Solimonas marina]